MEASLFPMKLNSVLATPPQASMFSNADMTGGLNIGKIQQHQKNDPSPDTSSKKKKEKRKKKKSRRRSSSSSSSSSDDDYSETKKKRKLKRGRESDDSDSSSGIEEEKKENKSSGGGTGLTKQQRDALFTQKDGYQKKLELLEREIDKLQAKEDELKCLRADIRLIEENLKLQAELKGRCKAVHIVLEKINDVLQVDKGSEEKVRTSLPVPPPPPKIGRSSTKFVQQPENPKPSLKEERANDIDYIDNGLHWCRLCNVFPETVEKMLDHFHSQAHHNQVEQLGIDDKPWHKRNSLQNKNANPGAKKIPFRGMQFFSPVEGWYCRLCNAWMGDHHCATDHLKSYDHNSNYMNFLEEHPEWESKWSNDREKACVLTGLNVAKIEVPVRKSRFEDRSGIPDDNLGSIRVQMRNTVKVEESKSGKEFVSRSENAAYVKQDAGLDEWMGKSVQKVPVDIIDTQKFAEIVRQKHGNKLKEDEKRASYKVQAASEAALKASPVQNKERDLRETLRREDAERRHGTGRVEMQISSRENNRERDLRDMRDRYRDNRGGGGRKRSRSRSRERERDRGYHGRRRSRSKSRSRDRDRRDSRNNREKIDPVKKLPIIGKMPLFKRPVTTKDKTDDKEPQNSNSTTEGPTKIIEGLKKFAASRVYEANLSNSTGMLGHTAFEGFETGKGSFGVDVPSSNNSSVFSSIENAPDNDLKPPGEKEAPGGTNLPDDLQQALDIIYKGGGQPITIPPPNMPGGVAIPTIVPPPSLPPTNLPPPTTTNYGADYGSYMGYEPYQMSFDEYAPPPGYEDPNMVEVSAPGTTDPSAALQVYSAVTPQTTADVKPPGEEEEDDEDDLRMLGIDLDDVAVVRR